MSILYFLADVFDITVYPMESYKQYNAVQFHFRYLQKQWNFYMQKRKAEEDKEDSGRVFTRWERDLNLGGNNIADNLYPSILYTHCRL